MDLVLALARRVDAELVIANDPDADRLAVAVPDPAAHAGYTQLTGNEVGALLGAFALDHGGDLARAVVIATIVSSPMLGVMARARGALYAETLTGFKWITNRAMELEASAGARFLFGYEEALGYTVGTLVRDKDGVSAALAIAELAAGLAARGSSLRGRLEELYRTHGLFVSTQVNVTRKGAAGAAEIRAMMDGLRGATPAAVGGRAVVAVTDVLAGTRSERGEVTPVALPKSNVLALELEGGCRVIARPSGTEPKVKLYVDVREPVEEGEPLEAARARATETLDALAKDFVRLAIPG